jgi:nucleoside-diphosphate-sugar epimerase
MMTTTDGKKGKLLVLGGTGFLGQTILKRAVLEGYSVTSVSRRGVLPNTPSTSTNIDYRKGDAREKETIVNILNEGGYTGVIHCIGLLFDDASGLGNYNRFVSGSKSVPDSKSSYDSITRLTAFNAIDATVDYVNQNADNPDIPKPFPFCFTSAAEAGWPEMAGGSFIEENLAPDWLKRYLAAKRAVETKLLESSPPLRPIIVRPSLIYSLDRPLALPSVGAFFIGNKVGLPFVDRPVTVQALSHAIVRSMDRETVSGIQRYTQIDALNE